MAGIERLAAGEIEAMVFRAPGPVALDFYQASGLPCHVLEARLERAAYRVDLDSVLPVAARFAVMSLPTVVIVRGGREVERLDGLIASRPPSTGRSVLDRRPP